MYYYNQMNPTTTAAAMQSNFLLRQNTQIKQNYQIGTSFQQVYQDKIEAPNTMDQIFEEAAKKYGIDVSLLKAIGKAESDFDPNAKSSAGAMGVMQLMPCNVTELGVRDPYDPRENIMAGARHFSDMLKRYDGDVELALAGYNAGSGNVAKYGGVPPFRETQNYIKKVLQYAKTPIMTGKTVSNQNESTISDLAQNLGMNSELLNLGINSGISTSDYQQNCQYLLEMMKLQMNQKFIAAGYGSGLSSKNAFDLSGEEEEDWNLLL